MKRAASSILSITLFISVTVSCKKDTVNPIVPSNACVLQEEYTGLVGNQAVWEYAYDKSGNLITINHNYPNGTPITIMDVGSAGCVESKVVPPGSDPVITELRYEGDMSGSPTKAFLSITLDGITRVNYKTFFFFYDSKGRLYLVGEQTDNIIGDLEWDLHIFYNDQDNVTGLSYEITTGPTGGSVINVEAYDDKPTPYAGIKSWRFLLNHWAWDNYDPEPILTALSKNNPLDYALNKGTPGQYLRTMTYEYNENGFPLRRINTNKNASGEYTFEQTFAYECR